MTEWFSAISFGTSKRPILPLAPMTRILAGVVECTAIDAAGTFPFLLIVVSGTRHAFRISHILATRTGQAGSCDPRNANPLIGTVLGLTSVRRGQSCRNAERFTPVG